jgi:hypothetical protein
MDFLFYLSPVGQQILSNVMLKNFKVQENAPMCKKYKELFGITTQGKFIVCTDNIKNTISPVDYYVNETVYHEAVHVAQACKRGPLGIKNPHLSPEKLNDVKRSTKYNKDAFTYEVEAYYLEDKPEEVLSYIKKYCF